MLGKESTGRGAGPPAGRCRLTGRARQTRRLPIIRMNGPRSLATIAVIASFLLAQVPFGLAEWVAMGSAPDSEGLYYIVVQAAYDNITAFFPLKYQVNGTSPPSLDLTIELVSPIAREPPVDLKYDIKVGGSSDFDLAYSNLTFYYSSEQLELSSGALQLEKSESGYWHAVADLPLKGEYTAVLFVEAEKDGTIYRGGITTSLTSDTASANTFFDHSLDKRVLLTGESFEVSARLAFEGAVIPDLSDVSANMFGTVKGLSWDEASASYKAEFTAPGMEGVYPISVYSEGQGFGTTDKVFVGHSGGAKSARCPLAYEELGTCSNMNDVRRCVYDYKAGVIQTTEADLILCFAGAKVGVEGTLSCAKDAKGDLNGNGRLDIEDIELMQTFITPLVDADRLQYKDCADYDRDGNVDEDDLVCLTNVVATKWHGDMRGGVCFNATYDSPLKCDLTGDGFIGLEDEDMLQELIDARDDGIASSKQELSACDMNQDGKLSVEDKTCIGYFAGLDLDEPETLLSKDQKIPGECLAIYTLDECQGIRGDVNGDGTIDQVDEVLEMLIYQKQISGYALECADVNKDGFISVEDVLCVLAYTQGDKEFYYVCIGCGEYTPYAYRYPIEVCNDQFDNNCDGLVDRTDVNGIDFCQCSENTPCEYVWDEDGGQVAGVDDQNVRTCRKASWDTEVGKAGEYFWMAPGTFQCADTIECESVECHGESEWRCSFDGAVWDWRASPEDVNEYSDPLEVPTLCEDGYDNDCACGDQKCDEVEEGPGMFENWIFWAGFVVGVVVGAVLTVMFPVLGPIIILIMTLLLTGGGMFVKDPAIKAAMSGFSMGMAIGGLAGSAGNIIANAATPGYTLGEAMAVVAPEALVGFFGITSLAGMAALTGVIMTLQAAQLAYGMVSASKTPYDPTKIEWDKADMSCSEASE